MTHMIGYWGLDKPAVSVERTNKQVKVVGERMAVVIPMPSESLSQVKHLNHWKYHDILYHSNEDYPGERTCEVCDEHGETEIC